MSHGCVLKLPQESTQYYIEQFSYVTPLCLHDLLQHYMDIALRLNNGVLLGTANFRLDGSDNIQFPDGFLMSLGDYSRFRSNLSKEEQLFAKRI